MHMRTVVYQSYRVHAVPEWIAQCMASVRKWAALKGYEYRFFDDTFFSYAPDWYREKVKNDILLVSDLARLNLAKELLVEGYERTIWIDADVIVFDPERFALEIVDECSFCKELWVAPDRKKQSQSWLRVNNAVTVFMKGNHFLDYYIHACQSIVRHNAGFDKFAVGTRFLTTLHQIVPFKLINQVGLFSPFLMGRLAGQEYNATLQEYERNFAHTIHAANLCSSFRNTTCHGVHMNDDLYAAVINNLCGVY